MNADLAAEFAEAANTAKREHYDWLVEQGVPRAFLYRGSCQVGVAEIETGAGGLYQPYGGGDLAFIMPARPIPAPWDADFPDDDPGDLVAWLPSSPWRWWSRCGMAPLLNPRAIDVAHYRALPLACWSMPLRWLRAGGDGVVILQCDSDLRLWFGSGLTVHADTLELGEEIERRLRQPPALARVLVPVA